MTLKPLTETREEITLELQKLVREQLPLANAEQGFPIFDVVIKPFTEIVYSSRETVEVLRQISSVLPLFDADGALQYLSYKEILLSRYFITEEYQTPENSFLTVLTERKTNMFVAPLSYAQLGETQVYVFPTIIAVENPGWYSLGDKFAYDVPIQYSSTAVPASQNWDTEHLDIRMSDGTELYGVVTKDQVAQTGEAVTPTLTLQTIQDSISNRSYSNRRALRFHLTTDLVFNPADLHKFTILGSNDRTFIEGYYQIYKTSTVTGETVPIQVRTGGRGKIVMDYGFSPETTMSTLIPVGETEPSPYDVPRHANRILYKIPIKQDVGLMHPTALFLDRTDTMDTSTVLTTEKNNLTSSPSDYTYKRVYDTANKRSYCEKDTDFTFHDYPVNTLYKAGMYVEWDASIPDIVSYLAIYGVGDNVDRNTTTVFYPTFIFSNGNKSVVVKLYSDHADGAPPVLVATGFHAAVSPINMNDVVIPLSEEASSGITAEVKLSGISLLIPSTADQVTLATPSALRRFVRGSAVLGVSNDNIYVELAFNRDMTSISLRRDVDNHKVYLVHIGTDANKLALSQAALYDVRKREIPSDIGVAPYRAVVFTLDLSDSYVAPLQKGALTVEEVSNYNTLVTLLTEYFKTYTGTLEQFNIDDVYMKFSGQAGGLTINRLDYYLYTQYGLEVGKGYLSVFDPDKHQITQAQILADISSTVDGSYPEVIAEEQAVFSPNLYKLIFSPVFRTN